VPRSDRQRWLGRHLAVIAQKRSRPTRGIGGGPVSLLIEQQLINWLAEATGTTPSVVVQRLAAALSGLT
jgi:hypothetical protein